MRSSSRPFWPALAVGALALAGLRLVADLDRRSGRPATGAFGTTRSTDEPRAWQEGRAMQPGRGRNARSPWQIPWRGWKDVFWRVYQEINEDRLLAVAAGVVFYGLLALFPAITAFVSLYGLFAKGDTLSEHLTLLAGLVPSGAFDIVKEQVTRIVQKGDVKLGFTFLFGLGLALWSANAGMKALIDALNVVYDETEKRSFIKLNLVSLGLTLGAIAALLVAIGAVVVFPLVMSFIGLGTWGEVVITVLRWPLLFLLVLFGLGILYRYGPSRTKPRWQWFMPGTVFAARGLARGLGAAVLVPVQFRRLRCDLRLARRRHWPDDVDVALHHRDPGWGPRSTPRSSTRPRATPRSGRKSRSARAAPLWRTR